jgi:ADP-ribosylglycohydrolase
MNRDKVVGMFLGVAIGDALGKPVETCSQEYIANKYGRITGYISNKGHKWFDGDAEGTTTDDWQLTAATAEGIIHGKCLNMDAIAAWHGKAFKESVMGWGKTTKEAVANIVAGQPWSTSGKTDQPARGTGNGICMKVAPIGAQMALTNPQCNEPAWGNAITVLKQFARMTHYTRMGVQSGYCQAFAIFKCLTSDPADFKVDSFIHSVVGGAMMGSKIKRDDAMEGTDDLAARMKLLYKHAEYDTNKIVEDLGGGNCYIYNSLPFTYMFFVKNPLSVESLYDCVSAGGDADTNGSMLASLLGALHGPSIFPEHLVNNLRDKDVVIDTANRFYDAVKPAE